MATKSVSSARRVAGLCFLTFLGLALGIASSEVMVRLMYPVSDYFWEWDPMIGMKLIPGKHGRSIKQGLFDVPVDVNAAGFRDRDHAIEKSAGVRRVVLLGDSLVEALQVPFEETITSVLEKRLQNDGIRSEVINFGVSGNGTAREYLTLKNYGLKYKPDLVLLFFVGNDFGDNTRRLKGLSYVPYPQITSDGSLVRDESGHPVFTPFADQSSRFSFLTAVLRDHSRSYRVVRESMDALPALDTVLAKLSLIEPAPAAANQSQRDDFGLYEIYRTQPKPEWSEGRQVTEELLVAIRNLAAENGAEFAVVLVPAAWEVYPKVWQEVLAGSPEMRRVSMDLELPSTNLTKFLADHSVRTISLLSEFRARAVSDESLYLHADSHWTAAGHRLAADLISRKMPKIYTSGRHDLASVNDQE